MPSGSLIPRNGSVTYGPWGSSGADFASFDIAAGQAVDTVTPYNTSLVCSKNVGSGTPDFTFTVGAFALAHATNAPPVLSAAATNATTILMASGGVAATFQLDTGVSEAATVITASFRVSHARMRGFVPFAITGRNAGDVTEVWATA